MILQGTLSAVSGNTDRPNDATFESEWADFYENEQISTFLKCLL